MNHPGTTVPVIVAVLWGVIFACFGAPPGMIAGVMVVVFLVAFAIVGQFWRAS